jgi:hypothetical protein
VEVVDDNKATVLLRAVDMFTYAEIWKATTTGARPDPRSRNLTLRAGLSTSSNSDLRMWKVHSVASSQPIS